MSTTHERIDLRPGPTAPAEARRFVSDVLARWGAPKAAEVVLLLTSEVVTNAVLHAGTPVSVEIRRRGDRVRVAVEDRSPTPPMTLHYRADAPTGRGLSLVASQAADWGSEPTDDGKVVWFEVPL